MVITVQGVYQNGAIPPSTAAALVPVQVPISMPAGADVSIAVSVVDQAGAAFNITGATFEMAIREFDFDAVPKVTKAGVIVSGAGGTFTFALVPADTKDITFGSYRWAAWMKVGGLRHELWLSSPLLIKPPGVLVSEGP